MGGRAIERVNGKQVAHVVDAVVVVVGIVNVREEIAIGIGRQVGSVTGSVYRYHLSAL
ncbi:MAG: hypothetical protein H6668_19750 [Ardenticatenaceae bacterium]|nr:hypothetical protein [Ardenticatenaceae bacterium]